MDQGSGNDGVGKPEIREGLGEDGPGPVHFWTCRSSIIQGLIKARPTLNESDRQGRGKPGGQPLHGVARDRGKLGYLAEAGIGTVEVTRGGMVGAC